MSITETKPAKMAAQRTATPDNTTQLTPGPDPAEVVELRGSQAEPGGPPVRVDPQMVNETTAARMRPSPDARHI